MASVDCPWCKASFDGGSYLLRTGAALAGAATGAYLGGGIGLVVGPLGAFAAFVPGAIVGGTLGWLGLAKFARCPRCKHTFPVA